LLYGIDLAVVLVGNDLTLRRFTPTAEKLPGLIPADVGRPILNINPTLKIAGFQSMIAGGMSEGVRRKNCLGITASGSINCE
jgi:two-component system, chemotaxis family, CheB/CheR fusion protein